MKIMNEYTYHQIIKNKRHTVSILVAIAIASALLCSLCIFMYSFWQAKITTAIDINGYWHGELYDSIDGSKLDGVINNPEVECTMVKGTWITAKLEQTKKPYLLMRDGDKNFWNDMNLKNTLTEGRLPIKHGEIVIGKQFFTDNPFYHIGDTLSSQIGERMLGEKVLGAQSYKQEKETFRPEEESTYTIVGMLDVSDVSAYPGYIAMGYIDVADIKPTDQLTVYMRLNHPHKIYDVLPQIADAAGLKMDERGQYSLRYNTALLGLYGIGDGNQINFQMLVIIAMAVIILLLVMGAFVLIIYNAFSLSANSRSRELSVLKSLGATPKQIKFSVLYEGFILWLVQSPFGIIAGYLFSRGIFTAMNDILSVTENYKSMVLSFSWIVIIISLAISLITVLVSAYIPAKKMAKVPAVEGIQQTTAVAKKDKNYQFLHKLFRMEGELAGKQFGANKRSLRTAIISLTLCLTLIISYINIISIYNIAQGKNTEKKEYDMSVQLNILDAPDAAMIHDICSLPEVKESMVFRQVRTTTYVTETQESEEFAGTGGFSEIDIKYPIAKNGDKYKIVVNLVGLEDNAFRKYCDEIGTDSDKYYESEAIKGILYDNTYHKAPNSNDLLRMPMLNLNLGTVLHLYERMYEDTEGSYEFDVQVATATQNEPGELGMGWYRVALVIPMEKYLKATENFISDRRLEVNRMSINMIVGEENSAAKEKINKICGTYLGTEDFTIWSLAEEKAYDAIVQKAISIAVYAVAMMFGIIGIFNAFTTVSNNVQIHKREYAMLRSIGLTPAGLNKMLTLEGFLFAISPILIGIPFIFIICWYMLRLTSITWLEYMSVFPAVAVIIYAVCLFIAIFLAYYFSSKSIKHDTIIESIQNEII